MPSKHMLCLFLLDPTCDVQGILGGVTYVNAFYLLSQRVEPSRKEFSMGVVSIADTFGIATAGAMAVALNAAFKNVPARIKH